jgi:seryl-tRNA synthetase
MVERQEYMQKLEEDANRLVDMLRALKSEVGSYKSSATELDKVRDSLASFIQATEVLTRQSHEMIAKANEINISHVFEQLESLQKDVDGSRKKLLTVIVILSILLGVCIAAFSLYLLRAL